jgi:hypothetical protein
LPEVKLKKLIFLLLGFFLWQSALSQQTVKTQTGSKTLVGSGVTITSDASSITFTVSGGGGGGESAQLDVCLIASQTWTNQPAAEQEFQNVNFYRHKADLSQFDSVRVQAGIAVAGAAAGTAVFIEYSLDGTNFFDLGTSANSPIVTIANTTGSKIGAWTPIIAQAKTEVWLRVVGVTGNGTADPQFRFINAQFK